MRLSAAVEELDTQLIERVEQAADTDPDSTQPLMWFRERATVYATEGNFSMLRRLARIASECAAACAAGKGPEPTLGSAGHYQAVADIIEIWVNDQ